MPKLFDEKSAFNQTDETYIGTWFGYDIWLYDSGGKPSLLAVHGNEGGDYSTWVGDERWFADGAKIGIGKGVAFFGGISDGLQSIPLEAHLTSNDLDKAFLMGFAAIFNRNGGDLSGFEPEKNKRSYGVSEDQISRLRFDILSSSKDSENDESNAYFMLALAAMEQAAQFMKLASMKDNP